jgi:hypothetical protein
MRACEYIEYALIAGVDYKTAQHLMLGRIVDLFRVRLKYDANLAGAKLPKRLFGG